MGGTGRALPSSLGVAALALVLILLGLGGALLVGSVPASSSLAKGASPEITFSVPPTVWAVLFLVPLLVGFLAYFLRLVLGSEHAMPARIGAGLAIAVVAALFLLLLPSHAPWTGSSTVTIGGGSNGGWWTNDTSGTAMGAGPGNGTSGGGVGGTGSGGSGGSGSNSSSGKGAGGSGNGSSSGGPGKGSHGGGSSGSGGSGSGSTGSGGSGGGGNSSSGSGNCSAAARGSPSGTAGSPIGVGNCTTAGGGGRSGGSGLSGRNNTTAARGEAPALSLRIPNWMFLPLAIGFSAVVGLLAVPGVLSRLVDRRPARRSPTAGMIVPEGAAAAFRDARLAIENGERPREAIIRLYGRILGRVVPNVEDLASSTAEEIERTQFAALHVPPTRSEAITTMFEEARYSTHPIDQPVAERFVDTLRAVEQDIVMAGAPR